MRPGDPRGAVTLVRPDAIRRDGDRLSSTLPPDLLVKVRGRVRLLALLLLIAFGFDLLLFVIEWVGATFFHTPLPADFVRSASFQWLNLTALTASAGLWWVAREGGVTPSHLHDLGLLYEIAVCAVIAVLTEWRYYLDFAMLPNLTWVPAVVILFPLILPGPPRRMLGAAIVAASTVPLVTLVLNVLGKITATSENYFGAVVSSGFAVGFAYMGARVVYGLGREVAVARELGSYHLEDRLGQGGMGEVWRARHRMLARPAAIKLIRSRDGREGLSAISSDMIQRFEREAQAIASLRSPHTVEIFDFGVADDGAFYYVMELLEGLDADALVRRFGPVPPERVIHLVRQIAHSLSEAHGRGLVHRDIKPANVFVCRYGEDDDFVKVVDFGLVKSLAATADSDVKLTGERAIHGTPAFIAPEQALGASTLDGRVDIYATGCVAYWLLTAQLVFDAETPMGLVTHHAHTLPEAPSTRTDRPIPEELDQLILSCLAKDPNDRPPSAKDLARQLAEIPVSLPWTEERAQEWWSSVR